MMNTLHRLTVYASGLGVVLALSSGCTKRDVSAEDPLPTTQESAAERKVEVPVGTFETVPTLPDRSGTQSRQRNLQLGMRGANGGAHRHVARFIESGGTDTEAMCRVQDVCAPELGTFQTCFSYATNNPMRPLERAALLERFQTAAGTPGCDAIRAALGLGAQEQSKPATAFLTAGNKATLTQCQRAAEHLAANGGLLGEVMGEEMMKEGDNQCEGNWSASATACLATLQDFTADAMKACDL